MAFLVLLALLPAGAAPLPMERRGDGLAALPVLPDPRQERNAFRPFAGGLVSENGRRRAELSAWGLRFTPYLEGAPHPEAALGFRLLEVRRGDTLLYAAPPEGVPPEGRERPDRGGYTRSEHLVEIYQALDFAVEQSFLFPHPLPGEGDLILTGVLSTTLRPEGEGRVGQARFPLGGGVELFYGPAVVRDKAGRESPVELHLVGNEVRLAVPGAWLAEAAYPVVVDPLLGEEVNITNDLYDQASPAVAASDLSIPLDDYRFLAVWADDRLGDWDIWAQTLKADGTPKTGTLISLTVATGNQLRPAVAYNPKDDDYGNRYLVVWQDGRSDAGDIYGRRVRASTGQPDGAPIVISNVPGAQVAPAAAFDPDHGIGYYLVAWEDYRNGNADIYVRRVRADGVIEDPEYLVAGGPLAQSAPAVSYDRTNGRWLVVWEDFRNDNEDIYGALVWPQDTGPPSVTPLDAIAAGAQNETRPSVAANTTICGNNCFLVTWQEPWSGSLQKIRGRFVSFLGELGNPFDILVPSGNFSYEFSAVAYKSQDNGRYLVAADLCDPPFPGHLWGRLLDQAGGFLGDPFQISTGLVTSGRPPDIAPWEGPFQAIWWRYGSEGVDGRRVDPLEPSQVVLFGRDPPQASDGSPRIACNSFRCLVVRWVNDSGNANIYAGFLFR